MDEKIETKRREKAKIGLNLKIYDLKQFVFFNYK